MAFHSYTRLIQKLFNAYWCGPPSRVTGTSPWPSVDHSVSRLPPMTMSPYSGSLSLRVRTSISLASPVTATRRFIMQKARRHHLKWLRPLESARFQELFHSPRGVLFTFPSRYSFAIGLTGVFSLAGWARQIHTGFLVSRATQVANRGNRNSCTGLSPSMAELSDSFHSLFHSQNFAPTTPMMHKAHHRFGLFPVRSPLLGESLLFSLPTGTKMFQFPALALI